MAYIGIMPLQLKKKMQGSIFCPNDVSLQNAAQQSVQPTAFGAGGRAQNPCKRYGVQWSHPL
jgi:hypothetical protein